MEVENRLITLNSADGIRRNSTALSDMLFNFQNMSTNVNLSNTFTIPVGNYNANNLITTMNNLVTAGLFLLKFSFSSLTGKITITANSGSGISSITFGSYTFSTFWKIAGLATTSITGSSLITFPYPLNLLGVKKLIIKSQLLGVTSFDSGTNQSVILTTIPNNNAPFTMLSYETRSNLNKALVRVRKIDSIDIIIEDEDGIKVDFNNTNWSMTLVLENIRRMTPTEIPKLMTILERQNELVPVNEDVSG
ncbi:MAG: hypothetical protein EBR82_54840 [Caulobacteraceae bacterium]|nr:hypothetical protein [Caulobacteraceae bacterium]